MPDSAINELKKASEGLSYVSESDSPVHTFTWKAVEGPLTAQKVLEITKTDPGSKVREVPLDDFFATQEGYQALRKVIDNHLTDVKAFRVGEVNVRYYVVGKSGRGDLVGVSAEAVET